MQSRRSPVYLIPDPAVWRRFSGIEKEIFLSTCQGHSYRDVANELGIPFSTVAFHFCAIRRITDTHTILDAFKRVFNVSVEQPEKRRPKTKRAAKMRRGK